MLKKLKLDQTKKYEQSIAANEVATMLVNFVKGRIHYLSVGAEQGDILKWDDLIIEDSEDSFIHIQVKRQTTNFSTDQSNSVRNTYTQQSRKGKLRDLSPLDESMKSLADWIKSNDPDIVRPKRKFRIELPDGNILIKNDLEIRHFRELCENIIKPVSTVSGLEQLAKTDITVKKCYDWLNTWCEFENREQILKAVCVLSIKTSGSESDINCRTKETLEQIFQTDKVEDIRLKIAPVYIDENSTYTGAIKARNLLFDFKEFLLPFIPSWTQFKRDGNNWTLSGIHDLENNNHIERPSIIVPTLWSNGKVRNLKIDASVNESCKLSNSLIQLAIHQEGQVNTHCKEADNWKNAINRKLGNTLGISRNDLCSLNIVDVSDSFVTSDNLSLDLISKHEKIAEELKIQMINKTWELVVNEIQDIISKMESSEIRDALEVQWRRWEQLIKDSTEEQYHLFKRILHPKAEGDDILGELRIGAKTSILIADGIYLLLIIAVCLGNENCDWKNIGTSLSVNTIGLEYWSGPSGRPRKVREIDDDCILELIGKESADILILSKISASPNDLYEEDLMSSNVQAKSLASPSLPKLLVTYNSRLRKIINKGEIEEIKQYLNSFLIKRKNSVDEAVKQALS